MMMTLMTNYTDSLTDEPMADCMVMSVTEYVDICRAILSCRLTSNISLLVVPKFFAPMAMETRQLVASCAFGTNNLVSSPAL